LQASGQVDDHRIRFKRFERRNQEVVVKTSAQANQGKIERKSLRKASGRKRRFWGKVMGTSQLRNGSVDRLVAGAASLSGREGGFIHAIGDVGIGASCRTSVTGEAEGREVGDQQLSCTRGIGAVAPSAGVNGGGVVPVRSAVGRDGLISQARATKGLKRKMKPYCLVCIARPDGLKEQIQWIAPAE
jgi:hypothetical protein